MSVCVEPGEAVEGEGCRVSIYIYIDICTDTCVYFFLYIGCLNMTCLHEHILPLCIYVYIHISYVLSTDSIRYMSIAAVWEEYCGDTKEIVYMCLHVSI